MGADFSRSRKRAAAIDSPADRSGSCAQIAGELQGLNRNKRGIACTASRRRRTIRRLVKELRLRRTSAPASWTAGPRLRRAARDTRASATLAHRLRRRGAAGAEAGHGSDPQAPPSHWRTPAIRGRRSSRRRRSRSQHRHLRRLRILGRSSPAIAAARASECCRELDAVLSCSPTRSTADDGPHSGVRSGHRPGSVPALPAIVAATHPRLPDTHS